MVIPRAVGYGLVILAIAAAAAPDESRQRLLDGSDDAITRRAFLPSPTNIHGEFRLIRRGEATCAQTLLYTPSLRRAIQRFRRKEMRHWPADRDGHADSSAYLQALMRAKQVILERFEHRADRDDPRKTMLIEFVLSDRHALFAIYDVKIDPTEPEARILHKESLEVHDASREYVSRTIRLMTEAAFQ